MERLILFVKGACMGLADVVPGVSGGTIALVIGIYVRFIEGIRSINARWIPGLWTWMRSGFSAAQRDAFLEPLRAIHFGFLVPLALGIATAVVIGSRLIPPLLESHPETMFAFFFGLILASTILPFLQMQRRGPREYLTIAVFAAAAWMLVGTHAQPSMAWTTASASTPMTLEAFTQAHPSAWNPQQIFCHTDAPTGNRELRAAVAAADTAHADRLLELCAALGAAVSAPAEYAALIQEHHLSRRDPLNPFNRILVPENTPVEIPRPALWFMFMVGIVAISAMLLPGISGSFILLVLGAYYFILVALKGFIDGLVTLSPSPLHTAYVLAFGLGMAVGLLSFARVLSWLFARYASLTLAAMIGLMLGCQRVIWPFKLGDPALGVVQNILPDAAMLWPGPLLGFLLGFVVVALLTRVELRARSRGRRGGIEELGRA